MDSSKQGNPVTPARSAGTALEDYAQLLEEAKSIQGVSLWKDASGPDFLITVHFTRKPLLQRLRHAFLHVVGRDLPYGHFQKALLQAGDVPRLRRMLDEFESASREAASPR